MGWVHSPTEGSTGGCIIYLSEDRDGIRNPLSIQLCHYFFSRSGPATWYGIDQVAGEWARLPRHEKAQV